MNDTLIKEFVMELAEGKGYALLPSDYIMEDVVERAKVICPDTPDHIFHGLSVQA